MNPSFIERYNSQRREGSSGRLLGFIQCNTGHLKCGQYIVRPWVCRHSFLSVSSGGHGGYFPIELGYFISSSNGLFLCGRHPTTYHVGNPITQRWVSLPSRHNQFLHVSVGLACDERNDLEVCYKVVVVRTCYDTTSVNIPIETYSSITGKWRESILTAPYSFGISGYESLGSVFHWFGVPRLLLVVYDSSLEERGDREKHLQLIELPSLPSKSKAVWRTNDGSLWYGASNKKKNLKVWVLPKGKRSSIINSNEWTLMHMVGMDTLKKNLPITEDIVMEKRVIASQNRPRDLQSAIYEDRDYVHLVAFIPWDPRLVLVRLRESIFLYDLESETIDSVQVHGYPSFTDIEWAWYPYFDSVSLSSYALGLK